MTVRRRATERNGEQIPVGRSKDILDSAYVSTHKIVDFFERTLMRKILEPLPVKTTNSAYIRYTEMLCIEITA